MFGRMDFCAIFWSCTNSIKLLAPINRDGKVWNSLFACRRSIFTFAPYSLCNGRTFPSRSRVLIALTSAFGLITSLPVQLPLLQIGLAWLSLMDRGKCNNTQIKQSLSNARERKQTRSNREDYVNRIGHEVKAEAQLIRNTTGNL